jgi:hypothetical protein
MNHTEALQKLLDLQSLLRPLYEAAGAWNQDDVERAAIAYGEVEEVINRFGGVEKVEVERVGGPTVSFPNTIAAGFFSGNSRYRHVGFLHLAKIIGKVRQAAGDSTVPQSEPSVTTLIQSIRRFRECCQYHKATLQDEAAVQNILWIMLRSQYDRLEKEETLPKFGARQYRPDFGVPDLRTLVEAKFIGDKTSVASIQEEILADIPGYLKNQPRYDGIVVFVYDAAQKLRDPVKFIGDIRSVDGIIDVIVVPGID